MSTQPGSIPNDEILQAAFDKLSPEERLALETLATINVLKRQAGLAPKARPASAKANANPKRQLRKRPSPRIAVPRARTARNANISHEIRCSICRHEERDAIEEAFLHWQSPRDIEDEFGVAERAIYRHAHAVGLFPIRSRNLRFALGRIIERADRIAMTPECVIRAIHAFAKVNDEGQWVEPPKRLIVSKMPSIPSTFDNDSLDTSDPGEPPIIAKSNSPARPDKIPAAAPAQLRSAAPPEPLDIADQSAQSAEASGKSSVPPSASEPAQSAPRVWPKPAFVLDRSKFAHW